MYPQKTPYHKCRVLIIDDYIDMAESLREMLELNNHEVEVAYDGLEGIAKARDFCPEVVLCDIGLPRMNGYDVAKALRKEQDLNDIFLVALTGYALPEDLQQAKDAGFDCHLTKPVDLIELNRVLSQPLRNGKK